MSILRRSLKRLQRLHDRDTSEFRIWLDGKIEDIDIFWDLNIYRPIRGAFYDVYYGLRNLWQYKGLIWRDRDWDHMYLYEMLEFKLRRIGRMMIDEGHATISKHHGTKALIAAECAKRLIEGKRSKHWDKVHKHLEGHIGKKHDIYITDHIKLAIKEDQAYLDFYTDYLYKLMHKYSKCWWD